MGNDPEMNDMEDVEVAEVEQQPSATSAATTPGRNPFHVPHLDAKQFPLVGYFFASAVFMIASLAQRNLMSDSMYAYGVSIGVVGMFFAGFGLAMLKYKSEVDQTMLAYFLFVWAAVGACVMTFGKTPFTVTGNGYFSVWAMVIFGVQHCGVSQDDVKKGIAGTSSTAGLGIAAMVLIAAISVEIRPRSFFGIAVYTITLACLTVVLVGLILYMERTKPLEAVYQFYLLSVFAVMWLVMACLVTFRGPFIFTGNGYFASWVGTVLCASAALNARQAMKAEG